MPSFEIADCPTRLPMTETSEGGAPVQKGTLTLTVRNQTDRLRGGRITIEPQDTVQPAWFAFDGATPTSPQEIERDFDAKGSATVRVNLSVPRGEAPASHVFRVRVTAEDDPDNDFTSGPNVAFEVAAWKEAPPPREKFPWWAIAVAAVLVLVVGGAVAYLLMRPGDRVVPQIVGEAWGDAAKSKLDKAKIPYGNPNLIVVDNTALTGKILALDPDQGKVVPEGATLQVYVATPPPPTGGGGGGGLNICGEVRCPVVTWPGLASSITGSIETRFPGITPHRP